MRKIAALVLDHLGNEAAFLEPPKSASTENTERGYG
jgi:hypothetical protein